MPMNDLDQCRARSSMLWMAILGAILVWSAAPGAAVNSSQRGQAYQISPKPCWVDGQQGTCMFVYECIKSEGFHIGMCVDTFMFGSCCAHNNTDNTVVPHQPHHQAHSQGRPQVLYTSQNSPDTKKPGKPTTSYSSSKPRPTGRPQLSYSTKSRPVTASPHGSSAQTVAASMNVRPGSSSRLPTQPPRHSIRPMSTDAFAMANSISIGHYTKPGWQSTTEPGFITSLNHNSMQHGDKPSTQWQYTTEPGFVTRVKKPSSFKPKNKPTKKPVSNTTKFATKSTRPTTTK
ncbi:serine proteinase stubble-like, partial [Anoplophora glabripennis]|uniref:serine proteinase stubble-like n=1 Tax=Anoplophora glabripennis TaxID=217634 RepID=UPI000874A725